MKNTLLIFQFFVLVLLNACTNNETDSTQHMNKIHLQSKDHHSYAKPNEARIKHLRLDMEVSFDEKILKSTATYQIEKSPSAKEIIFDTKDLEIKAVYVNDSIEIKSYSLKGKDKILGQALHIPLDTTTKTIKIEYETSPNAEALQWLNEKQTASGKPFLFTQSQAILCRSWIPIQDSPSIKFTYEAQVKVPEGFLALMSAENPQAIDTTGVYSFTMPYKIPAYLMALSVGDLDFHKYDSICGVYAEPPTIEKAKNELEDLDKMVAAASKLYGEYKWGRFDVLMLPPSFPFGGMENPMLTFATPTILAGDKSLTSLIAHELAHSWSGNLVTNATWDDFWLNEGFTVYFEYRIMEAVYGKEYANMLALISKRELEQEVKEMMADGKEEDTKLKLNLKGRNPDEGLTSIAYDKGYFFLKRLEELAGREHFDQFLANYFDENAFQTTTTEGFITYTQQYLFAKNNIEEPDNLLDDWVYGVGLPDDMPQIESGLFKNVESTLEKWLVQKDNDLLPDSAWSTHEWLHFLHEMPDSIDTDELILLDAKKNFTNSGNSEIKTEWMLLGIKHNYRSIYPELQRFLINTGRRKFLMPLYQALLENEKISKDYIVRIYEQARPNYHYVSYNSLDNLLNYKPE